ncbi:MAG: hypothetical protein RL701_5084 [Pseudomonadota bacterium]|jgi:hypothetical protein
MQSLPYQVFLTRNSEYHLESHICVGVRDRRTGRWFDQHPALFRPLTMTVCTAGQLSLLRAPQLGESLEFDIGGDRQPLRTSAILNIEERPRTAIPVGAPFAATLKPAHVTSPQRVKRTRVRVRLAGWARAAAQAAARRAAVIQGQGGVEP